MLCRHRIRPGCDAASASTRDSNPMVCCLLCTFFCCCCCCCYFVGSSHTHTPFLLCFHRTTSRPGCDAASASTRVQTPRFVVCCVFVLYFFCSCCYFVYTHTPFVLCCHRTTSRPGCDAASALTRDRFAAPFLTTATWTRYASITHHIYIHIYTYIYR